MAIPDHTKAQEVAEKVLSDNFIEEPPVDIREIAKNYGLEIVEVALPPKANDVAGYIDPETKTVYVNLNDSPARRNFTIAHELGHWILHQDKLEEQPEKYAVLYRIPLGIANKDPVESEANTFAANLLVPKEMLENYKTLSNEELAKKFGVSSTVIGYRLKDQDYERTAAATREPDSV